MPLSEIDGEGRPSPAALGGVKFKLTGNLFLRTEFRDYITAFPKEIITPAAGVKYGSLLHVFVPMVGIAYEMASRGE